MVIGTGCAIPGVMSCRTIRNERAAVPQRCYTPFMPCGAKIPVIALFAGAFFADAWWVSSNHVSGGYSLSFAWSFTCEKDFGTKIQKNLFFYH